MTAQLLTYTTPSKLLWDGVTRTFTNLSFTGNDAVVIAPPLSGNNWVDANGSGTIISPHRYTVQPTNGRLRPPEYFAIDFVRLDAQKRLYVGDVANVRNWIAYESDIRSVAPGKVVEVHDGMQNNIPQQLPVLKTGDEYSGDHVIRPLA